MSSPQDPLLSNHTYILITGANSGLGYAICTRLIDTFLLTRPQSHHLHLIPTVRTPAKAEETTRRLKAHLAATLRTFQIGEEEDSDHEDEEHDHDEEEEALRYHYERVTMTPELVDLTDLVSVRLLANRLLGTGRAERGVGEGDGIERAGKIPKLDVVIWNAGIGGWLGINTLQGMWGMATDLVETVTRPKFKIGSLGRVCKPLSERYPDNGRDMGKGKDKEPPLGELFTANVFGHYMLGHYLSPLIALGCAPHGGRVVWVGSIEADCGVFDANVDTDIMGLKSRDVYEDIKRLVDILALTADLPSTRPWVDRYFSSSPATKQAENGENNETKEEEQRLQQQNHHMYVTHPGICMTEIAPQPIWIKITTFFVLWLARLVGSIWHPIQPYKGAISAVWAALADPSELETSEYNGSTQSKDKDRDDNASPSYKGKGKYGSATSRLGAERVERTEVDGWGYDGTVQQIERNRLGRWRDAVDLTEERRIQFEEVGRKVWQRMEELRVQLEARVEEVIKSRGLDA